MSQQARLVEERPIGKSVSARRATAAKLTDRDKDLLGLLVHARYLTLSDLSVEPVPPGVLADAYLALGDKDRAFEWLERGVEEDDQMVMRSRGASCPQWDSLRSDPRYHKLLKRMNLE